MNRTGLRIVFVGTFLGLALPAIAAEEGNKEVVDPWAQQKPCSQKLNPTAAKILEKATASEKMIMMRELGLPSFVYMRPREKMIHESLYSFAGSADNNSVKIHDSTSRLLEMLTLLSAEEMKNVDLEEFRSFLTLATEWKELEEKCRTYPELPTPGFYQTQYQTLLNNIKELLAKAGKSPAKGPASTFGQVAGFGTRLSEVKNQLQEKFDAMTLAAARGQSVPAKQRELLAGALNSLNRVFNGSGKPLTPAALYDVVQVAPKDQFTDAQWALLARHFPMGEDILRHGAMDAWRQGATGKGVKIAVIDNGVDQKHPAFRRPFVGSVSKSVRRQTSADKQGTLDLGGDHGTGVGSAAMALAPEADLINIKLFPSGHEGAGRLPPELNDVDVLEGSMIAALEEAVKQGAQVISLSVNIGGMNILPNAAAPVWNKVHQKIKEIVAAGVVVAYAAGNEGFDLDKVFQKGVLVAPAALPEVIAVGAVDYFDQLARFSSQSQVNDPQTKSIYEKPDVVSYGVDMRLAQFNKDAKYEGGESQLFDTASGTSFATPQVAAIAALAVQKLKESGQAATGEAVRRLILDTARKPAACSADAGCDLAGYGRGVVSIKGILEKIMPPLAQNPDPDSANNVQ